ncbi:hypothetical protein D9758_005883 [Tetrapyrgos nigripes]|uniref:MI domain-containing protein n=1 Tax=Tetrapyrgos nigripes TaxID=182062 RepID=A0A8H5G2V1_9AGAR|nr:hypothetical protein D9758_005883 [Tetrapyrgos nigripes]
MAAFSPAGRSFLTTDPHETNRNHTSIRFFENSMSKSSTASAPKIPTPLPTKSAWSKGPPQTTSSSPRSQSPAPPNSPAPTHSRRPSTLGQGIPIKDGVSVRGNNVGATKTSSVVSFGSIGDASASVSSSSAAAPAHTVKSPEGVKTFGTVPATVSQVNGKSSVTPSAKPSSSTTPSSSSTPASTSSASKSTPTPPPSSSTPPAKIKMDVKRLFQKAPSSSSSHPPSESSSSAADSSSAPPPPSSGPPSTSQIGSHPFPSYGGPNGMRPPQQPPQSNAGPIPGPPRSPFLRQMNANGARPTNGANVPPGQPHVPPAMGSPRLGPPPHGQPGPPTNMPPNMPPNMGPPPMQWGGYYYMPDPNYMYQAQWGAYMPPQHMQHHPPPPGTPHSAMSHSPRNPPPPLQGTPGTPTPVHAQPTPHTPHPPHPAPLSHSSSSSINTVSSPPPTPSTATSSIPPTSARMNSNASPFIPGARPTSKITLKNPDGSDINLDNLKQNQTHRSSPSISSTPITSPGPGFASGSPRRAPIKIESPEDKKKREEKEKEESRQKAEKERQEKEAVAKKKEAEEKAKKEKAAAEEKARKEKEAAEKKAEEDRVRKEKEEADRLAKAAEEERRRKEKEAEEERSRKEKEEAEKKAKEEEERLKKEKEEAERKKREEEEEKERIRKEEEEAAKKAASEKEAKPADAAPLEEGEIAESKDVSESKEKAEAKADAKSEDKKAGLRIDTEAHVRRRPGPLDLSTTKNIPAPLPSALATARNIDDLGRVPYPEGVKSPSIELNVNAKDGKFRYDRDFLLQFMSICKEKPDMLPPLDAIGLEPADQSSYSMGRSGSHGGIRRQASAAGKGVGLGFPGGFGKAGQSNPFMGGMGNFTTPPKTSEERYQLANGGRPISVSSSMPFPPNRPGQLTRSASHGGPGMDTRRTRSKRGDKRDPNKSGLSQQTGHGASNIGPGGVPLEPVAPLQATANRWDRKALGSVDPDSAEIVDRKVKSLLNKLTMERFDSISDQIIAWANKSEKEKDGRTLIQVIRLVFEKATDEATWSEMYARLCRKMMEQISPKVQDDGIRNPEGKPIAGGQLFRKYLLNRCQEDFERGWVAKEATAAAAASKALEDQAAKAANEKKGDGESNEEVALYSAEYYAAQKAKRQGLGLIKFIGELFKLQMLTERIMHECVKKLLGNVENPEEEEIESLCKLLTTVGQILDTNKARAHMDVYFSRMKELTKSLNVTSRMQFMLQDVIELRDRKWVSRNAVAAPTTIAKVHEAAAKDRAAAEKESLQRQMTMSRGGSRRGAERSEPQQTNADGWAVAGGNAPRPPPKAGDLSNFGKITKGGPITFGPSSVFAGGKKESKRESISRTNSNANMFQMLQNVDPSAEPPTTKSSRPPSRKPSVDLGSGTPEAPPQRRKIVLQPRSKPREQDTGPSRQTSDNESDEEVTEEPEQEMSEEEAKKKIEEDSKEFFGVRNLDEAEVYFSKLSSIHHHRLVDKLVSMAIESKEADAQLVSQLFERAVSKNLCSSTALEEGFLGIAEFLDDIAIDAPKAPNLLAIMMKGAAFSEEQRTRIASKSEENEMIRLWQGDMTPRQLYLSDTQRIRHHTIAEPWSHNGCPLTFGEESGNTSTFIGSISSFSQLGYSTFTPLFFSAIFYASNGAVHISYIDALFNCVSAMTVCGLASVDLSSLTTWQQVVLFIQMCLGSPVVVAWVTVYLRKYYFEKKFEHVIQASLNPEADGEGGFSLSRTWTNLFKRKGKDVAHPDDIEERSEKKSGSKKLRTDMIRRMDDAPKLVNPSGWISEGDRIPIQEYSPARSNSNLDHNRHLSFAEPSPERRSSQTVETVDDLPRKSRRLSDPGTPSRPSTPINNPLAFRSHKCIEVPMHRYDTLGATSRTPFGRTQTVEFSTTLPRRRARIDTLQNSEGVPPRLATVDSEERRSSRRMSSASRPQLAMHPTTHTYNTYKSTRSTKHSGFGGFPMPHEIIHSVVRNFFPKVKRQLSVTATIPRTTTIVSQHGDTVPPPGAKVVPYISFDAVVGRNSAFQMLSSEQIEELGGVEYRALNALLWIVAGYHIGVQLVSYVVIAPYISTNRWKDDFVPPALHKKVASPWFALFQVVSSYTNTGMSLVDTSMVPFQKAYPMIIFMAFLIVAGNTGFTWFLLTVVMSLNLTDWFFFMVLDIGTPAIDSISIGTRFAIGLLQACAVRAAGFGTVALSALAPAVKVLYTIMISHRNEARKFHVFEIFVRSTNVYEEQSLGVFRDGEEEDEHEFQATGSRVTVWSRYLAMHARKQLSFDMWWLGLALFLRHNLDDESSAVWFNIFTIVFELVSAYGTVGLSLGLPTANYSFSGALRPLSKLIICLVMLRGRHRGLPVAIDRAVMLPMEFKQFDENDDTFSFSRYNDTTDTHIGHSSASASGNALSGKPSETSGLSNGHGHSSEPLADDGAHGDAAQREKWH